MCFFATMKKNWLENCPSKFKPVIYRRHDDETFSPFCSKYYIAKFQKKIELSASDLKLEIYFQDET